MAIERRDYYNILLEEGEQLYGDIYPLDQNEFNDWITSEFDELKTIESFDEVIPSRELIEQMENNGYAHRGYQCHYSAKAICLLDEEIEHWTGFIIRNSMYFPIATHSFNIKNNLIIDFSRTEDDFSLLDTPEDGLPHTYFGINIPNEFVSNYRDETFNDFSMRPLLVDWYKEINNL